MKNRLLLMVLLGANPSLTQNFNWFIYTTERGFGIEWENGWGGLSGLKRIFRGFFARNPCIIVKKSVGICPIRPIRSPILSPNSFPLWIKPVFGDKPITENTWFVSAQSDSILLENVRFYLSNIQWERADKSIIKDTEKARLVDIFDTSTLQIPFQTVDFQRIKTLRFNIGVDSVTNVSGAMGGDLDPQKGMYWAWQSGYIHLKIEGRSPRLTTRKNQFQFHLGGYLQPFYAMRSVELPVNAKNTAGVVLVVDVSKFFKNIPITTQKSIMSPCKEAMQLADFSVQMFSIQ